MKKEEGEVRGKFALKIKYVYFRRNFDRRRQKQKEGRKMRKILVVVVLIKRARNEERERERGWQLIRMEWREGE